MTSGGYTMTEAWNLQLQGRVRDLEADLSEAERHVVALAFADYGTREGELARDFLRKMAAKRALQDAVAQDIDAILGTEQ